MVHVASYKKSSMITIFLQLVDKTIKNYVILNFAHLSRE